MERLLESWRLGFRWGESSKEESRELGREEMQLRLSFQVCEDSSDYIGGFIISGGEYETCSFILNFSLWST